VRVEAWTNTHTHTHTMVVCLELRLMQVWEERSEDFKIDPSPYFFRNLIYT